VIRVVHGPDPVLEEAVVLVVPVAPAPPVETLEVGLEVPGAPPAPPVPVDTDDWFPLHPAAEMSATEAAG
jgi:hypothetical protein